MNDTTTPGRALAIAAGLAFLAGSLTILLGPALLVPSQWGQYHVLTMLMIGGTIAAGHLTKTAWKARAMSCVGFAMLFVAGTVLVVYNSVGRQAEQHDTITLEAEARNSLIEDKRRDIEAARERLTKAETNADRERGTKCKTRCQDWEKAAEDTRHVIRVLESEVKALGSPKPVDAKASKAGELAAVFGYDRTKVATSAALIEPFLWTIFFEIGSIVSLGFAFRPGHPSRRFIPDNPDMADDVSDGPFPSAEIVPFRPKSSDGRATKAEAFEDLMLKIDNGEDVPMQEVLVERWNRPKQTVSDWIREWRSLGLIPNSGKVGRCKPILAAA